MQSNAGVHKVLELAFGKKATISDKKAALTSIPHSLLTEDFAKKLRDVLRIRKKVYFYFLRNYIDKYIFKIISSYNEYLETVILSCLSEYVSHTKLFEKFISVCAMVMHYSEEVLSKTGVDFRELNTDIIMVFYQNDAIQSPFLKRRDFSQFEKFIRDHEYLKWNLSKIDHASPNSAEENSKDKIIKEEAKRFKLPPYELGSVMEVVTNSILQAFLSTSPPFPTLPSEVEIIKKPFASRKKDINKHTERKVQVKEGLTDKTSHGNSDSISDSKPNFSAAQQEDVERYEKIVKAVIRYNRSNISRHKKAQNQKLVEAEGTLQNLKTSVKSLMDILDEM